MATISRAQLLKELLPGLNALFGLEYKRYGEEHKEVFEVETSERSFEEEVKLSGFSSAPVKTEGGAIVYDSGQEAFTARYVHETIALGFGITEEAIEDNLYDSLSARYTKALARSMAYTKQVKAAAILNTAFATVTYGDGKTLCATDHPTLQGGVNANRPGSEADLNETSLEDAYVAMAAWTDERGLLLAAKPKKLVVHPSNTFVATRVLQTELSTTAGGASVFAKNDINALKSNGAIPGGYTVNHWLTDLDAWFLITDVPNGLKHFVRAPLKQDMEGDFETGNVRYKARERYSFGVSDPLGIYGTTGAG
jgi:hypothetical protein